MHKIDRIYQMPDKYELATAFYQPEGPIKGYIHILHGMSEYHGRYDAFATFLATSGYAVGLHSHRGHGENATLNQTPLGYYSDKDGFQKVVEDVLTVITKFQQEYDLPKPVLLGHSMGSLVARRFTQLYSEKISKAIFMGTLVYTPVHGLGRVISSIQGKWQSPEAPASVIDRVTNTMNTLRYRNRKTGKEWLSKDQQNVQNYLQDPFCSYVSTNQFYVDLLTGFKQLSTMKEVATIRKDLPILLISGKEDPIGDFGKGVWRVAKQLKKAGIQTITVYLFESLRHEILNEKEKIAVYNAIVNWLEKKHEQTV